MDRMLESEDGIAWTSPDVDGLILLNEDEDKIRLIAEDCIPELVMANHRDLNNINSWIPLKYLDKTIDHTHLLLTIFITDLKPDSYYQGWIVSGEWDSEEQQFYCDFTDEKIRHDGSFQTATHYRTY